MDTRTSCGVRARLENVYLGFGFVIVSGRLGTCLPYVTGRARPSAAVACRRSPITCSAGYGLTCAIDVYLSPDHLGIRLVSDERR